LNDTNGQPRGWVTIKQTAEVLGVTPQAVWQTHVPLLAPEHLRRGDRQHASTVFGPAVVDALVARALKKRLACDDRTLLADDADMWNTEFRKARAQWMQAQLAEKLRALGSHAYYRELWDTACRALKRVAAKIGYLPADLRDQYHDAIDDAERFIIERFHVDTACRVELHVWTPDAAEPLVLPLPSERLTHGETTTQKSNREENKDGDAGKCSGSPAAAGKRPRAAHGVPRAVQGPSAATQA